MYLELLLLLSWYGNILSVFYCLVFIQHLRCLPLRSFFCKRNKCFKLYYHFCFLFLIFIAPKVHQNVNSTSFFCYFKSPVAEQKVSLSFEGDKSFGSESSSLLLNKKIFEQKNRNLEYNAFLSCSKLLHDASSLSFNCCNPRKNHLFLSYCFSLLISAFYYSFSGCTPSFTLSAKNRFFDFSVFFVKAESLSVANSKCSSLNSAFILFNNFFNAHQGATYSKPSAEVTLMKLTRKFKKKTYNDIFSLKSSYITQVRSKNSFFFFFSKKRNFLSLRFFSSHHGDFPSTTSKLYCLPSFPRNQNALFPSFFANKQEIVKLTRNVILNPFKKNLTLLGAFLFRKKAPEVAFKGKSDFFPKLLEFLQFAKFFLTIFLRNFINHNKTIFLSFVFIIRGFKILLYLRYLLEWLPQLNPHCTPYSYIYQATNLYTLLLHYLIPPIYGVDVSGFSAWILIEFVENFLLSLSNCSI